MSADQVAQIAMWCAAACYTTACIAYLISGKQWMSATMLLYAGSVFTVWMAGTK